MLISRTWRWAEVGRGGGAVGRRDRDAASWREERGECGGR